MAVITKELVETEINNFLNALEMDLDSYDKDIEITLENGQKQSVNSKDTILDALSKSIEKGRLELNPESITAKYTFRKPLVSGDVVLNEITLTTNNCQAGKISKAKAELKNNRRFAGVILFSENLVSPNVLELMSQSEENALVSLAQLFFEY